MASMVKTLRSVLQFGPIERDPVVRRLARCANVDDLRRVAKRRLPGGVFDYIDGAAEDERTLADNLRQYADLRLRPHVLRDVHELDTTVSVLGHRLPAPIVLAPTGFTRIAHPDGELAVARAAGARGLPFTLSTLGTRSIEEVARAADGPQWFQLYVWRDRGLVRELLERAKEAGNEAVVVTVDTAVFGRRERDVRRGFTLPPKIGLRTLVDGAVHPAWTWQFVRSEPISFANLTGRDGLDGGTAITLSDFVNAQFDPSLSWADLDWIRSVSDLPIVLKGVASIDDAQRAADEGIEAIVVSNHGGRQLDGGPRLLDLLPRVADAVGDRLDVLCDGGVRRGSDVVKARALGAKACLIGRPALYALGAGGERGVGHLLDFLTDGIERTLALLGEPNLEAVGPAIFDR